VQEPLAGIDLVVGKVIVEPPGVAATAPVPEQVVLAFAGLAITTPAGRVSTSGAVKLAALAFGLLNVMVSVDTPSSLIAVGLKTLPSIGGTTPAGGRTVKVATAGAALFPLLVCNAPIARELK
jgi:hypothetical protein